jgi:glutamate decarboxylase
MVHLAAVPTDQDIQAPTISGHSLEKLKLENIQEDDDNFTTTVYGSKYAALDLPKYEMPDNPMPKEIAYRMIK